MGELLSTRGIKPQTPDFESFIGAESGDTVKPPIVFGPAFPQLEIQDGSSPTDSSGCLDVRGNEVLPWFTW